MQKLDYNIGFLEKTPFFPENWQKLQKIAIITLTPDRFQFMHLLSLMRFIVLVRMYDVHVYTQNYRNDKVIS
jgi:hypothetical protein